MNKRKQITDFDVRTVFKLETTDDSIVTLQLWSIGKSKVTFTQVIKKKNKPSILKLKKVTIPKVNKWLNKGHLTLV